MKIIHYTTLEIGLTYIIETMKLRFGPLPSTNDPREYKQRTVGLNISVKPGIEVRDIGTHIPTIKQIIKEEIKMGCFVAESEQDWKKGKGIKKSRMWAQYGGGHTGMAFVFDKDLVVKECRTHVAEEWAICNKKGNYSEKKD